MKFIFICQLLLVLGISLSFGQSRPEPANRSQVVIPQIYLITVSGGPDLFSAFGHSALWVTGASRPEMNGLYEYGLIDVRALLPLRNLPDGPQGREQGLELLRQFFAQELPANVTRIETSLDSATGLPDRIVQLYLRNPSVHRRVTMGRIDLNVQQARALLESLRRDLRVGNYPYNYYNSNCATRIRDRLYSSGILGAAGLQALRSRPLPDASVTRTSLIAEALNHAGAMSLNGTVSILPNYLRMIPSISAAEREAASNPMFPVALTFRRNDPPQPSIAQQFQTTLEQLMTLAQFALSSNGLGGPQSTGSRALLAMREYFRGPILTATHLSIFDSLFLPERLRAHLIQEGLIREGDEVVSEFPVVQAAVAPSVPAPVAPPAPEAVVPAPQPVVSPPAVVPPQPVENTETPANIPTPPTESAQTPEPVNPPSPVSQGDSGTVQESPPSDETQRQNP